MSKKSVVIIASIILGTVIIRNAIPYGESAFLFLELIIENGKVIQIEDKKYQLPDYWAILKMDDNYTTIYYYSSPSSIYYLAPLHKGEYESLLKSVEKNKEFKIESCSKVHLMNETNVLYLNKNVSTAILFDLGKGEKLSELCRWLEKIDDGLIQEI